MASQKKGFAVQCVQVEGAIVVSARIPEEQIKTCGKFFWGAIVSGVFWAASHLSLPAASPINNTKALPPAQAQVYNINHQ